MTEMLQDAITLLKFIELRNWVLTPSEASMCRDRLRRLESLQQPKSQDATVSVTGVSISGNVG